MIFGWNLEITLEVKRKIIYAKLNFGFPLLFFGTMISMIPTFKAVVSCTVRNHGWLMLDIGLCRGLHRWVRFEALCTSWELLGWGDSAVTCRETAVEGTPMCKPPVVQSDSNRFPTSSVNTYALNRFIISLMKLHQVIDGTFSISAVWPEGLVCEAVPVMGSWGQPQFGW